MMNWDEVESQWKLLSAMAKVKWARLTEDDLAHIAGDQDSLISRVQERYDILKMDAERQVKDWVSKLSPVAAAPSTAESKAERGGGE
jgi:uncharacterized protein YjbJ (UPF0337 family)